MKRKEPIKMHVKVFMSNGDVIGGVSIICVTMWCGKEIRAVLDKCYPSWTRATYTFVRFDGEQSGEVYNR